MSSTPTGEQPRSKDHKSIATATFRPDRLNLLGALVMFLICLIFVGYKPYAFFWVLLFPILFGVWVMRARTHVTPRSITAIYLFRKKVEIPWDQFHGIRFNRAGKAFASTGDGSAPRSFKEDRAANVYLPGITFNSLPELSEVTGGLIPDPITPSKNRDEDEITTVNRDGYAVIKTADEAAQEHNARAIAAEINRRKKEGTYSPTHTAEEQQ